MREEGLRVKSNGGYREVAVEVIPLKAAGEAHDGGFLVLFEDSPSEPAGAPEASDRRGAPAPTQAATPSATTHAWRRSWPPPASTCSR